MTKDNMVTMVLLALFILSSIVCVYLLIRLSDKCEPCPTLIPTQTLIYTQTPTLIPTQTIIPTQTPTITSTQTATPTQTPTPTSTQTRIGTQTPTPAAAPTLNVIASPKFPPQGSLVSLRIEWNGGPAEIGLLAYPAQTCCADPYEVFTVDGPSVVTIRIWIFSNAVGDKTFSVYAKVDGEIVRIADDTITVLGTTQTPTPVITATPTQTVTPSAMLRLEARTWHYVENPTRLPLLWLYNATFPVGGPGGQVWSYDTLFRQMDWEVAGGHGWLILETNGGDVWLWIDTIARIDIAAIKFTERAW